MSCSLWHSCVRCDARRFRRTRDTFPRSRTPRSRGDTPRIGNTAVATVAETGYRTLNPGRSPADCVAHEYQACPMRSQADSSSLQN